MTDAILVIGGGIAGINCAMNAAKYGAQVYLVDDTASIGGMMARLDKTFPTNDCSICIEAPQMYEVDNHANIKILTQTEVRRVQKADGASRSGSSRRPNSSTRRSAPAAAPVSRRVR